MESKRETAVRDAEAKRERLQNQLDEERIKVNNVYIISSVL